MKKKDEEGTKGELIFEVLYYSFLDLRVVRFIRTTYSLEKRIFWSKNKNFFRSEFAEIAGRKKGKERCRRGLR